MRVRELGFRNFRSFRDEQTISFTDSLTESTRPLTVIAGSNGTGKTTIFEAIEALLAFVLEPDSPRDLVREAWETGLVRLTLELSPKDLPPFGEQPNLLGAPGAVLNIMVGQRDLVNPAESRWPNLFCKLVQRGRQGRPFVRKAPLADQLRKGVSLMRQGEAKLRGGWLYFPHDRQLNRTPGGAIEPPPQERRWLYRYSASDQWQGSLEQLWLWQNYLDLEQGNQKHEILEPFVSDVEAVLGTGRRITVREGRVRVATGWAIDGSPAHVRLDQLPSGEQQVLLLFGEMARRRRSGAVIALDEIENSLHPTLQRLVMHELRRIAREWDGQLILATHSLEILRTAHECERISLDSLEERAATEALQ